jgi:hypothetical protein
MCWVGMDSTYVPGDACDAEPFLPQLRKVEVLLLVAGCQPYCLEEVYSQDYDSVSYKILFAWQYGSSAGYIVGQCHCTLQACFQPRSFQMRIVLFKNPIDPLSMFL